MPVATIESLDQEGRGVAHFEGKVIFIEGALPGEMVEFSSWRKKPGYEFAHISRIIRPSSMRVAPRCAHFGVCGGCSMQHLDSDAQVAMKQRVLEDNLWHIGKIRAETILPAIYGAAWEYRWRARLSVRFVEKKGRLLVGFHEKRSSFVAEMNSCEILPQRISRLIVPLRELIGNLTIRNRIPQVEVAIGEEVDVLVLRILEPLAGKDETAIRAFAERHGVQIFLQPKGPDSAHPLHPTAASAPLSGLSPVRGGEGQGHPLPFTLSPTSLPPAGERDGERGISGAGWGERKPGGNVSAPPPLYYTLPEFDLAMPFHPTEFTQVNPAINRVLVRRALGLLDPRPGERIADLFCGLGNFALAVARRGAEVVGVEGSAALVRRAQENAAHNGLDGRASFLQADLFQATAESLAGLGRFDKMLIDPPRDGAIEAVKALGDDAPRRIVYVSCNPATLARDAAVLAQVKGYVLKAAGVVNMFPHTSHVESVAQFERK